MHLVDSPGECFLDGFEPMLAADDLQRMLLVEFGRELRDDVAEAAPSPGVILHSRKRTVVGDDLPVGTVFGLILGVEWHVGRRKGHQLVCCDMALRIESGGPGIHKHMENISAFARLAYLNEIED